jgi:hypothetical protein
MFGWFGVSCTVDAMTKQWIDGRWRWLTDQFGKELANDSPTVLPTAEFFPDHYDRSEQAVRTLVDRVCGFMSVSPSVIDLEFFNNANLPRFVNEDGFAIGHPAGTYHKGDSRFVIRIEQGQFERPMTLVGTVAHELAHLRLLGEGRITNDVFDNELLTDLTVVFHGMGIFLANCPRHWDSHVTTWPGTKTPMSRYMTTPMYGYAIALRCWLRNEPRPAWRKYLKPAVRAEFRQALRFLEHTQRPATMPR